MLYQCLLTQLKAKVGELLVTALILLIFRLQHLFEERNFIGFLFSLAIIILVDFAENLLEHTSLFLCIIRFLLLQFHQLQLPDREADKHIGEEDVVEQELLAEAVVPVA